MIALTRSRQRAEEFAALVDDTGAPVRPVSNESAASASARELDRLVGVVAVMRREASADEAARPQPAFAADLRERLMAEAVEVLTPQQAALVLPPRTRGKRERRLVAAATAAVLLGGTAGIASAAQGALPGEALYPIKRGIEDARVGLATSPGAEGRQLLAHATDRLAEVQGLVAAGPGAGASQIPATLGEFSNEARRGADLLLTSYADNHDPETIATLRAFAARDQDTLTALADSAPPEAQPALGEALTVLSAIDARASQACDSCSSLPPLTVPAAFRATSEADRALSALSAAHVDNSHPVIAPRDAVKQADATGDQSAGATDGATGEVAGSAPAAAPTSAPLPKAPDKSGLLPGLAGDSPTVKLDTKTKLPPLGSTSGGTGTSSGGDDLGAGLGDAIETLLPDVGGSAPTLP
jgi:hypothetical protein